MTDRDPSLDIALRLLVAEGAAEDEARWAKRIAAGIGTWTANAPARDELEALLVSPLPDGFDDIGQGGAGHDADDLEEIEPDGDAASATDQYGHPDRGYSISHPPLGTSSGSSSGPPSNSPSGGLEGLARLTRSGQNPASGRVISSPGSSAKDSAIGAAKADDSGLIDLRGLSQSGEKPAAAPSAGPVSASSPSSPSASSPSPSGSSAATRDVSNVRALGAAAAPLASAIAPPSTMTAHVASGANPATPIAVIAPKKKSGAVVWVAFAGLAAAAAIGIFFMTSAKKSETAASDRQATPTGASNDDPDESKQKSKKDDTVAIATASASTAPAVDETASADPDDTVAAAPTTPTTPTGGIGAKGNDSNKKPSALVGTPTGTAVAKPTATAVASAEPPKPNPSANPSGGSLDDVLGINKPPPIATATANVPDLPDKPEAADIRVAVNSKVGTANSCVKGLDAPSSVSVVFSPAGTVASVSVTAGPAKGTGAESCIKSAFSSAKVSRSKLGGTGYAKLLP